MLQGLIKHTSEDNVNIGQSNSVSKALSSVDSSGSNFLIRQKSFKGSDT